MNKCSQKAKQTSLTWSLLDLELSLSLVASLFPGPVSAFSFMPCLFKADLSPLSLCCLCSFSENLQSRQSSPGPNWGSYLPWGRGGPSRALEVSPSQDLYQQCEHKLEGSSRERKLCFSLVPMGLPSEF